MNKYSNNVDSINIQKKLNTMCRKNLEFNKNIDNVTLNTLFNLLLNIKTSINNIYINSDTLIERDILEKEYLNNSELIEDLRSKYVANNIEKYIITKGKKQIVYKYKNKLTYIVNFIIFTDVIDNQYLKYLDMCVVNIFSIIDFLERYRKNTCNIKTLELYIFLTNFKKELPISHRNVIGPENVNTGLTIPCRETTRIVIYRKEEFMKLAFHELIHAMGIDIPNIFYTLYTTKLDAFFGIESTYNLNETYTEIWSMILNILFIIAINNDDSMDKDIIKKEILTMLEREIMFSALQVHKILDFMTLSLNDLQNKSRNNIFKEDTHVFSYYILKYILLYNISEFILISSENINFQDDLSYKNGVKKVDKILELIFSTFSDKKFIDNFTDIEKYFKTILSSDKYHMIKKTLRMTSLELA